MIWSAYIKVEIVMYYHAPFSLFNFGLMVLVSFNTYQILFFQNIDEKNGKKEKDLSALL